MKTLVTSAILKTVLVEAETFEQKRDFDSVAEILSQVWDDFMFEPDTAGLTKEIKAEFLRLCGNFLVCYGRAKNKPELQEPAKNLLTKADELFKVLDDSHSRARTAYHLALSYCYDGRYDSAYDVTTEAERLFEKESADPVYLQLKINQLISLAYRRKFKECNQIINKIGKHVEAIKDTYLPILFFNQCGYVFSHSGDHSLAVKMYSKAVALCNQAKDDRSLSQASNNLADALRRNGYPEVAVEHICRAIALALKFEDTGFLTLFEDTKANILLALGDPESALNVINQNIYRLQKKGDARILCEAYWTKFEILFSIGKRKEAMYVYTELGEFARTNLSEEVAGNYAEKLFERLSPQTEKSTRDLPTEIVRFYPENEKLVNLPAGEYMLFFVPARFSPILGRHENLIVCTIEKKHNPVIIMRGDTEELFLGNLQSDDFLNFGAFVLKTGEGEEEVFFPDSDVIEGHVCAVAVYSDTEIDFRYL